MFPVVIFGSGVTFYILLACLARFLLAKILMSRSARYQQIAEDLKKKVYASVGGFTIGGAGGGWSSRGSPGRRVFGRRWKLRGAAHPAAGKRADDHCVWRWKNRIDRCFMATFVTWIGENKSTPALFSGRLPRVYGSVSGRLAAWEVACEAGAAGLS